MSAMNETLVRDIVTEVMGRINGAAPVPVMGQSPMAGSRFTGIEPKLDSLVGKVTARQSLALPGWNEVTARRSPALPIPTGTDALTAPAKAPERGCGCPARGGRHRFGVFQDANQACAAAQEAFLQLRQKGLAGRECVVRIVKTLADANAAEWGRVEFEETKMGRLDHKIEKLRSVRLAPGVEWLQPDARSGDHGITLEEYMPFGVIGAVTPRTDSIATLSGNVVSMAAAGNAVVFNAHPSAARCAAVAVRAYNEAIRQEIGIENLICIVEPPTLESFQAICDHESVKLLLVTGGPAVVKVAMKTGKRAICAGPGNPPVLVDDTCCLTHAARSVILGAAYDNNLLCVGEKQVFVLDNVADKLMGEMSRNGAVRLNSNQLERLTRAAFSFKEGPGGGAHVSVNRELIGRDASVLARAAGVEVKAETQLLFAETEAKHPFVEEEQMMPFLPVVRVKSVEEGIAAAKESEHQYRHTSLIHSHNVEHMTAMARALDTTIFVKNGPCTAGLGLGGEGYLSYSIATPTGEGVTNPKTFTRVRRCVMVDNLQIY